MAEEVEQLVDAYEAGSSIRELAMRYAVHAATVKVHLARAGIAKRKPVAKLSTDDAAEAARLYANGLSLAQVGKRIGVSVSSVRRALERAGVQFRPRPGWSEAILEET